MSEARQAALQRARDAEARLFAKVLSAPRSDLSVGIAWYELIAARAKVVDDHGAPMLRTLPEFGPSFRPNDLTPEIVFQLMRRG